MKLLETLVMMMLMMRPCGTLILVSTCANCTLEAVLPPKHTFSGVTTASQQQTSSVKCTPPTLCYAPAQELSEYLGLMKLNERLAEPSLQEYFTGIFPQDTMQNMRFSINFFTSIGLGGITDRQREMYKQVGGAAGHGGTGVVVCLTREQLRMLARLKQAEQARSLCAQ
jgi:hypothetical protein